MHLTAYGTPMNMLRKCWGTFGKDRDCEVILARWSLGIGRLSTPLATRKTVCFDRWNARYPHTYPLHLGGWCCRRYESYSERFVGHSLSFAHTNPTKTVAKRVFPFHTDRQTDTHTHTHYFAPNGSHKHFKVRLWLSFPTEKQLLTQRQVF